jgi:RNA polymerase sigma-70 factor (ECF subfamily)
LRDPEGALRALSAIETRVIALTKKFAAGMPAQGSPAPNGCENAPADPRISQLVQREYPSVWRFLRRLGVPSGEVDDAAQRVFARVLAQADRIQVGSERAYLMRAAFRAALEQQRAKKRWLSRTSALEVDETSSAWPEPDQSLAQREDLRLLDNALAQLPPDLRAVFTLSELEELSFSEIALALSLPRGTVASRVRRAKERFAHAVRRLKSGGIR